jgi:hypothetical protein
LDKSPKAAPRKRLRKPRGLTHALKGEMPLTTVYWPWFIFFSFLAYLTHALRQVIANTPGGAITGMIIWALFALALPVWFYCVWVCGPNSERDAWMYLSRTSLILIAYYAVKRLMFLALIIQS